MSTPRRKATAKPKPPNNPYGIDALVWSKIVGRKKPTIGRIMFAAALDPLLLVDLKLIQPPRSLIECVQLADMGTRGDLRGYLKNVLIKRVMSNSDTVYRVVHEIASWDIRLGVWCAAACAESVLRFIPEGEDRPRLAVEAVKDWVFGVIDETAVRRPAVAAADAYTNNAAYSAPASAANAAVSAASAAYAAAYASASHAANAAADAANAAAYASANAATYSDAAFFNVIARAIESYPVGQ